MFPIRRALPILVVFGAVLCQPLAATTYMTMSDAALTDRAGAVADVTVVGVEPAPFNGPVATDYLVEVNRVLKGNLSGSTVVVRVPGGQGANGINLKIWGAPCMTLSPQFAFMSETLSAGKLGRIAAAHADYGHTGPDWSAFFYEKGGGSLPDLAVYNLTSLTGLLGPAKQVAAMTSIVTPSRRILRIGDMDVEAEDNAMVLMDHGDGVLSHVQSGFNYFNPNGHDGIKENRHTITIVGNLTADPELRFTPSGAAVANFTVASTPRNFDRQTNEWKDGRAYDPKKGSSYNSSMRLNRDGSLRITGCVLFVCQSVRWTRTR